MARWRHLDPPHLEAPAWYRSFDPAQWDAVDAHEQRMIDGNLGYPWSAEIHLIHAQRRWGEAKHRYQREHPAFATQEFEALVSGEYRARREERERDR
jgi:hypothetical protein